MEAETLFRHVRSVDDWLLQRSPSVLLPKAKAAVKHAIDGWAAAPPINVVMRPDELPAKWAPDDARGMYRAGSKDAWVVASNNATEGDVHRAVAHEVIAHHGLRQLLGKDWAPFMSDIHNGMAAGDADLVAIRNTVRAAYRQPDGSYSLNFRAEADEVAAAVAEIFVHPITGRFTPAEAGKARLADLVGDFARKGLYLERSATFREVQGKLLAAQSRMRHGDRFFGLAFRTARWYCARMAQNWQNKPLMSHEESKRLLAADERWRETKDGFAVFGYLGGIVVCVVVFVVAVAATISRYF